MTKVAVVFHSGYGHTVKQAEAIAKGANGTLVAIDAEGQLTDAQWDILQSADAIVFGSPTYMGSVTWQFKKFADTVTGLGEKIDIISQGGKLKFHLSKRSNELTNHDIDMLMHSRDIRNYHGCFIKDQLPRRLLDGFYIINLNGSSHWTALCKDKKKYYYFDSYGFVAPDDVEQRIDNYTSPLARRGYTVFYF
jgi:hypothetical protein